MTEIGSVSLGVSLDLSGVQKDAQTIANIFARIFQNSLKGTSFFSGSASGASQFGQQYGAAFASGFKAAANSGSAQALQSFFQAFQQISQTQGQQAANKFANQFQQILSTRGATSANQFVKGMTLAYATGGTQAAQNFSQNFQRNAKNAFDDIGRSLGNILQTTIGNALAGGILSIFRGVINEIQKGISGITGEVTKSIGLFISYSQKLSEFRAVSGASKEETDRLSKDVLAASRQKGFSPKDVAGLAIEVSKAGTPTQDITQESLKSILNIAKVAGGKPDKGAEILGNVTSSFDMSLKDATQVADLLTVAANKSQTSVEALGNGLSYTAANAVSLGVSLKETVTGLALMSNAGLQGSRAGTAMANMLKNLAENAGLLKQLGVDVFDTTGKVRPLLEIFKQLQGALAGLSKEDRFKVLEGLFNERGIRGANAMLQALSDSSGKANELISGLEDVSGASEKAAGIIEEGIGGKFTTLSVKIENLETELGAAFEPALVAIADFGNSLADALLSNTSLFEDLKNANQQFGDYLNQHPEVVQIIAELLNEISQMIFTEMLTKIEQFLNYLRENPNAIKEMADGFKGFIALIIDAVNLVGTLVKRLVDAAKWLKIIQSESSDTSEGMSQTAEGVGFQKYQVWSTGAGGASKVITDASQMKDHHSYQTVANGNEVRDITIVDPSTDSDKVPVPSALRGRVKFAGEAGAYGNMVDVEAGDGSGRTVRIAHLDSLAVKEGDEVQFGQKIGVQGSTGRSQAPHLHIEAPADIMRNYINHLIQGYSPSSSPKMSSGGSMRASGGSSGFAGGNVGNRLLQAIKGQESGGNPEIVNTDSGALGLYQIMPDNLPSWSKAALGREVGQQEFLKNPDLQTKIASYQMQTMFDNAMKSSGGNQDIAVRKVASEWYSGQQGLYDDPTPQYYGGNSYPSIREYTTSILGRFKSIPGGASSPGASKMPVERKESQSEALARLGLSEYGDVFVQGSDGRSQVVKGSNSPGASKKAPGSVQEFADLQREAEETELDKLRARKLAESKKNQEASIKLLRDRQKADMEMQQRDSMAAWDKLGAKLQGSPLADQFQFMKGQQERGFKYSQEKFTEQNNLEDLKRDLKNIQDDPKRMKESGIQDTIKEYKELIAYTEKRIEALNKLQAEESKNVDTENQTKLEAAALKQQEELYGRLADQQLKLSDLRRQNSLSQVKDSDSRSILENALKRTDLVVEQAKALQPLNQEIANYEKVISLAESSGVDFGQSLELLKDRLAALKEQVTGTKEEFSLLDKGLVNQNKLIIEGTQRRFTSDLLGAQSNNERSRGFGFKAAEIDRQKATFEENNRFNDQMQGLEALRGVIPNAELQKFIEQAREINLLNLDGINRQFQTLDLTIKNTVQTSLQGFFRDAIMGTQSFGDAFNSLIDNILNQLLDLALNSLFSSLFGGIGVGAPKQSGGGVGGFLGSLMGSLVPGFANGGIVPGVGNTDSVLAMLTPGELVIPKDIVSKMPKFANGGIVGGGGFSLGGASAIVNVNVSGDSGMSQMDQRQNKMLSEDLETAVVAVLQKHKLPRGELYSYDRF